MGGYWQSTIPDKGIVSDPEGNFVADCGYSLALMQSANPAKAAANAALIVQALNLYTGLLAGLRNSLSEMQPSAIINKSEKRRERDRLRKREKRAAEKAVVLIEEAPGNSPDVQISQEEESLVYDVPTAGAMLGLTRNASYLAAKRGDIPTLKIGKLRRVPKAALHAMLVPTPEQTK